jgi:hypothetical protein
MSATSSLCAVDPFSFSEFYFIVKADRGWRRQANVQAAKWLPKVVSSLTASFAVGNGDLHSSFR